MSVTVEALDPQSPPPVHAAVCLGKGGVDLHGGVVYRGEDGSRVLHLAWHADLRDEALAAPRHGFVVWVIPTLDDEYDLRAVADTAAATAESKPEVLYSLRYADSKFSDAVLLLGESESGLTCATFVLALYRAAGIELLRLDTWEARERDRDAQKALVRGLERDAARGKVSPEHVKAVRAEEGCMRFRPEEVAAGTALDPRPVDFSVAAPAGDAVRRTALARVIQRFLSPVHDRLEEVRILYATDEAPSSPDKVFVVLKETDAELGPNIVHALSQNVGIEAVASTTVQDIPEGAVRIIPV